VSASWLKRSVVGSFNAADRSNSRARAHCGRRRSRASPYAIRVHGMLAPVKEDVLEQVVDDFLNFGGYLTTHNVGFRPRTDHPEYVSSQDSVRSDVDVVGYHPKRSGIERVIVVSCKAWQSGFDATAKLAELRGEKKNPKRETWRQFRELWIPKWSEAFREAIYELTGERDFTYRIAVTRLQGDGNAWAEDATIRANLGSCSVGFLPLEEMWRTMLAQLTTTPAPSEIGRLAQLLKAAGLTAGQIVAAPTGPAPGSEAAADEAATNSA
jgi:hypothetical protein